MQYILTLLTFSNREEFVKIISQLKSGEPVCQPVTNEDSSSVDVPTQIEVTINIQNVN